MPTILVQVESGKAVVMGRNNESEQYPNNRVELSPTAFGFLIPLFVIFIFGPIAYVVFIRRGMNIHPRRPLAASLPVSRREDARKKLASVTEVSNIADGGKFACRGEAAGEDKRADSLSILERECAICLAPLYAPSPPEPAKLGPGEVEVGEASMAPSALERTVAGKEDILKLKVCGHEFHAECLISWFILWKYSCPICRAVYHGKEDNERTATEGAERTARRDGESQEAGQTREVV